MTNLNMNTELSYNVSNDSLNLTGGNYFNWDYWKIWPDTLREYYPYPAYYGTTRYEDIYKKAFNIAKLLLKKNLLVSRKLKDFIGLVEEIAKEIQ